MIVMKCGGTSVADAQRIAAVAEIVRSRAMERPIVIVSALGEATDLLQQAIDSALCMLDPGPALNATRSHGRPWQE